ncbi:CdaR family protein [Calditrichota bacterium LG25]
MKLLGKDLKYSDYRALLGSFFLALLLWAAVTTNKVYTIRVNLPFEITRLAEGYVLSERPPRTISLKLRGKGRALLALYFYKPIIRLELPSVDRSMEIDLNEYQNQFYVGQELGITIEGVLEPKKLVLKVDRYREAFKPVQIKYRIKPMPGYSLTGVEPETDSVMVMGPANLVNEIEKIESETITVENVRYPFSERLRLFSPYPEIVEISPLQISVKFVIEQIVERQLYNIPVQIIGAPKDIEPLPIPPVVSVRVKGSEGRIKDIEPGQITAIFNYAEDYRIGRNHYVPKIELPEGVSVVQVSPKSFRLMLKKKDHNQ